jgi:hypothetical protein
MESTDRYLQIDRSTLRLEVQGFRKTTHHLQLIQFILVMMGCAFSTLRKRKRRVNRSKQLLFSIRTFEPVLGICAICDDRNVGIHHVKAVSDVRAKMYKFLVLHRTSNGLWTKGPLSEWTMSKEPPRKVQFATSC